jgi:hypothetical protein
MRSLAPFLAIAALAVGCSSTSSSGGSVSLSFGDAGASAATFTTTPAGAAHFAGEFSASGDYEAEYTLSTTVPMGSPLASCLLSVDGATPTALAKVDDSTGQTHALTLEIQVWSGYQGQAVCNVSATNASKLGVGDIATVVVAQ